MSAPFTYNDTPIASHFPGDDQPLMQTNFISLQSIIGVDHVSFDTANATQGRHDQVTYSTLYPNTAPNLPLPPTVPSLSYGISYVENDSVGNVNQWFVNPTANYLVSCVKAFGAFVGTVGTANVIPTNSLNIASITKSSQNSYSVNLTANVVTENNVVVFINTNNNSGATYTFASGVLTISLSVSNGVGISFAILQA